MVVPHRRFLADPLSKRSLQTRHWSIFAVLVVGPMLVIASLAIAATRRSEAALQQRRRELLAARMGDWRVRMDSRLRQTRDRLRRDVSRAGNDPAALGELRRRQPEVRAIMLVNRDGMLLYPTPPDVRRGDPYAWHAAMTRLARNRPRDLSTAPTNDGGIAKAGSISKIARSRNVSDSRWQPWFFDNGLQLVLWVPISGEVVAGVVLERGRWIAEMIDSLPEGDRMSESFELRDENNRAVYVWGDPPDQAASTQPTDIRLLPPLASWTIAGFAGPAEVINWTSRVALIASLVAVALVIAGLAFYLASDFRRQLDLARQQVSFAGQVSHELRTPLTNIRLYADLARADLEKQSQHELSEKLLGRLEIISRESTRLADTVSGVLAMLHHRGRLDHQACDPDALIRQCIREASGALHAAGIKVTTDLKIDRRCRLDETIVRRVIDNLLGNVVKYVPGGGSVELTSRLAGGVVVVDVIDDGPGVSAKDRKRIFEPFARVNDSLEAPAGTGLGLAIARQSARRHGGDLVLVPATSGCHFRATFASEILEP